MARLGNLFAVRWDWDTWLEPFGAWAPRGITTADVDSETEQNGHYLVLEGKREKEEIKGGQKRAMDARVKSGRECIIVYGNPGENQVLCPNCSAWFNPSTSKQKSGIQTIEFLQRWPNPREFGDWKTLHYWLSSWSQKAERKK